jgi:hypothetical protein
MSNTECSTVQCYAYLIEARVRSGEEPRLSVCFVYGEPLHPSHALEGSEPFKRDLEPVMEFDKVRISGKE